MPVVRFGVSLEEDLLKSLDNYVVENGFSNRSQAIRQLVNDNLVKSKFEKNQVVAGAIIFVYNHHKHGLLNKINKLQHDFLDVILSTQHFHLNHDNCLEIIALKGKANKLSSLAEKLISIKGIEHGQMTISKAE